MTFDRFFPTILVYDSDKVAFMPLQNIDTRHLANLLPIVEENIKSIPVVHILEYYNVFTEFSSKVT